MDSSECNEERLCLSPADTRPLKQLYWIVILVNVAILLAAVWYVFVPPFADTDAAKRGFQEMTGLSPDEVSEIYYAESYDFHGDYSKHLRFTYPNEQWRERFLAPRTLLSRTATFRGDSPNESWWNGARISQLSEFYEYRERMPWVAMAIDGQNRQVYLFHYTF